MSRTVNGIGTTGTGTAIPKSITYSDITVDKVEAGQYQKDGTLTAQIRQTVTTISSYPSKQVTSDKQDGLFDTADFGFGTKDFPNVETRVAWIPVPVGTTIEQVQAKLVTANTQGATIYRAMSNQPILDNNQKNAVKIGLGGVTLDTFANRQVVRFPAEHLQEGQICLDANNKVQYRRTFFCNKPLEDQDFRSTDPADVYMSSEIAFELSGQTPASVQSNFNVREGQTL